MFTNRESILKAAGAAERQRSLPDDTPCRAFPGYSQRVLLAELKMPEVTVIKEPYKAWPEKAVSQVDLLQESHNIFPSVDV